MPKGHSNERRQLMIPPIKPRGLLGLLGDAVREAGIPNSTTSRTIRVGFILGSQSDQLFWTSDLRQTREAQTQNRSEAPKPREAPNCHKTKSKNPRLEAVHRINITIIIIMIIIMVIVIVIVIIIVLIITSMLADVHGSIRYHSDSRGCSTKLMAWRQSRLSPTCTKPMKPQSRNPEPC